LKRNDDKITGVLHHQNSQTQYNLRRYFPEPFFENLIEQFWFVDWNLAGEGPHNQQNLPDPNFHLIIDKGEVKLIGPVSKIYSYTMVGKGSILGVKFSVGALSNILKAPISEYLDKEFDAQEVLDLDFDDYIQVFNDQTSDEKIVELLQSLLKPLVTQPCPQQLKLTKLVELIKTDSEIYKVADLLEQANISIRTIQRLFHKFLGLSPKWLIRKYRLHQALEALESKDMSILDLVVLLGYTDQSHLIKDFKDMLGLTPGDYYFINSELTK